MIFTNSCFIAYQIYKTALSAPLGGRRHALCRLSWVFIDSKKLNKEKDDGYVPQRLVHLMKVLAGQHCPLQYIFPQ